MDVRGKRVDWGFTLLHLGDTCDGIIDTPQSQTTLVHFLLIAIAIYLQIKLMLTWTFEDTKTDEAFLDFGNMIEYAALVHDTQNYRDSLLPDVFSAVLRLVASENLLHSLLGHRVLQHLLDRNGNLPQFDTPR